MNPIPVQVRRVPLSGDGPVQARVRAGDLGMIVGFGILVYHRVRRGDTSTAGMAAAGALSAILAIHSGNDLQQQTGCGLIAVGCMLFLAHDFFSNRSNRR